MAHKDYNKLGFIKAFKKAVPNFNELICHFEFKSRGHEPVKIKLVWDNKLWSLEVYKSQYYIDLWANHFIDFFNTGTFDYNGYWRIYKNRDVFVEDTIYKIPLCSNYGNNFYEHSPELKKIYNTVNGLKVGREYGLMHVPKPLTNENIIEL